MCQQLDILIPTYNRAAALAVTLTSLVAQTFRSFRVVVADQSTAGEAADRGEIQAVRRVLAAHNCLVEFHHRTQQRGMAEQRQYLLDQTQECYALYLDDDLILEPWVLEQMISAIRHLQCGFVGSAVLGLTFLEDIRPNEQEIEFWEGPVEPEIVEPGSQAWQRYRLHNAANLYHVQSRMGLDWRQTHYYKVAWVGGCTLYDTQKLRQAGGFNFWNELPNEHCGEDALAQLRVMQRYGGCGLIPSGVYHQELPTTVPDRSMNAPEVLDLGVVEPEPAGDPYLIFNSTPIQVFPYRLPSDAGQESYAQ